MILILCVQVEMTIKCSTSVGENDLADVVAILSSLTEKKQIFELGLMLGIGHKCLTSIKQSDTFLMEMIYFWLTGVGRVAEKGKPT